MPEEKPVHDHDIEWKVEKIGSTKELQTLFYEGECSLCCKRFREVYVLSGYYEVRQSGQENEEEIYLGDHIPEDCQTKGA